MRDAERRWDVGPGEGMPGGGLMGRVLRNVFVLVAICAAVAWVFSSRDTLLGVTEKARERPLEAARGQPEGAGAAAAGHEMVIQAGSDGHFLLNASVNGTRIRFLVDTGASNVVLSPKDARRLGLNPGRQAFTQRYQTANGVVRAAPVELRRISIGQFSLRRVRASVTQAPLGVSLLGMSFLGRLRGYEVRGDRLILRW